MYDQEFQDYKNLWAWEGHSPDWPLFRTSEAERLVWERAASLGGKISISAFIIAFDQLRAEGRLKQVRNPLPPEPLEPELTVEQYRRMPTQTIIRKYQSDPEFRSQVENLIALGQI